MLLYPVNQASPVRMVAANGSTVLFSRFHIYDAAGALDSTLPGTHIAEGIYTADWTPTAEGIYTIYGQFFTDAGFTIDANYDRVAEMVDVNSTKSAILRLLGLHHENAVIDQQTYDVNSNLTSARLRTYDSKANALLSGGTGLLFTYTISATYTGEQLNKYTVVLEP